MSEQDQALHLRRYEPSDAPAVWHLYEQAWAQVGLDPGDGPWDHDLRDIETSYLAVGGEFLVAEVDGQVVATGALQQVGPQRGEIRRISVDAAFQRRGYGSALLDRLEAAAREAGYATLVLDTTARNHAAQALYRGRGYVPVDRVTASTGFESIVFEKRLQ